MAEKLREHVVDDRGKFKAYIEALNLLSHQSTDNTCAATAAVVHNDERTVDVAKSD